MSGLFSVSGNSVDAISAHSRAIEPPARILADVSNPNYARQRVLFGDSGEISTPQGPASMGLQALGMQAARQM